MSTVPSIGSSFQLLYWTKVWLSKLGICHGITFYCTRSQISRVTRLCMQDDVPQNSPVYRGALDSSQQQGRNRRCRHRWGSSGEQWHRAAIVILITRGSLLPTSPNKQSARKNPHQSRQFSSNDRYRHSWRQAVLCRHQCAGSHSLGV